MIPRTLSASSLQTYELCPDRWNAEYMKRGSSQGNNAAATGSAFHGGAEKFVEAVYIKKEHEGLTRPQLKDLLLTFYQMSYVEVFNSADLETPEYEDGKNLTLRWFARTDLSSTTVLSVEKKETIPIPFNHPDGSSHKCEKCVEQPDGVCVVPFNYIMDRVDQIGETEYEVVDYKTVRVPISPEDLHTKIQARAYALALQIKYPNATKIKVTFDLIRHDPISIWVSRDDNISFWRFLCSTTQRIVDTDESDIRPTLNPECGYCVKKASCKLLQSNVAVGGIESIDITKAVALVDELKNRIKAQKLLQDQLEDRIMQHAAMNEELAWDTEDGAYEVEIGASRGRSFNFQHAARIMGPELVAQVGKMNLGELDKIIADESLPAEMRAQLKELLTWETKGLNVKIKRKKTL